MSAPIEQGETYQYRHTVVDANGTPAAAGTVTATITLPDGSTTSPTVTNAGTGLYDFDYLTSLSGRHTLIGSATGGTLGAAVEKFDDTFNVEIPGRLLVGFDEARTALRATTTITSLDDREQLRWLILAASDAVERDLGRVVCRRTVTETYDGGVGALNLRSTPVISITSVTESGTLLTANDWVLDSNAGILYRGSSTSSSSFAWGRQNVTVVYQAGYVNPPPIVRKVALNGIQGMWQASQQASHPLLEEPAVEGSVFAAVGALTPLERGAYDSLRAPGIA